MGDLRNRSNHAWTFLAVRTGVHYLPTKSRDNFIEQEGHTLYSRCACNPIIEQHQGFLSFDHRCLVKGCKCENPIQVN